MSDFIVFPIFDVSKSKTCPNCNGRGYIESPAVPINSEMAWAPVRYICCACNGSGEQP